MPRGSFTITRKKREDSHLLSWLVMQLRGLEPLPKYMDMNLNHARMPIPPQLHIQFCSLMIHIRKMQLTGLEPVRARLTRSLVLRVCQFRHNCIFCFLSVEQLRLLFLCFLCCSPDDIYIITWAMICQHFFQKKSKNFL